MYKTSAATAEKILAFSRTWRVRLENISSGEIIQGDIISTAESEHSSTSLSDDIEIGAVTCASWTVTLRHSTGDFLGQRFRLYFYLRDLTGSSETTWGDLAGYTCGAINGMTVLQLMQLGEQNSELIPMGEFTCIRAPRSGDGRELTLVDAVYFSDTEYIRAVKLPAPASEVEKDVCRQLGIGCAAEYSESYRLAANDGGLLLSADGMTLSTAGYDFAIGKIAKGTTCRQMLGYIAGARGEFGCIDRQGQYTRRWYGSPVTGIDSSHADEPTISETANIISGIRCKVGEDEVIECGKMNGGRVLEFEDPYVDEQLLLTIFNRVRALSWYTCELYHRLGDPRIDIGDVVTVSAAAEGAEKQLAIPITGISFSFDGGLSADLRAVGLNDIEQI